MSKLFSKIATIVTALVLCLVCSFSLMACGGSSGSNDGTGSTDSTGSTNDTSGGGTTSSGTVYAVTITGDNLNDGAVTLKPGATLDLSATITANGKVDKTLSATWTTSDESIATVSGGTVTAVADGSADITATYDTASAKVTVTVSSAEEISYQGQTGQGSDEFMGDPQDVYWVDASVQLGEDYVKAVGFSLTVTVDSLDYYGGGKETQEYECGMILATKGAHSPSEYVFTYDNGQYPEYSLSTKDIVTFGIGESAFLASQGFSNGKTSNTDVKAGDTITLTYSTGGDKGLFNSGDPIMTIVSFLGSYTYVSVEWELGNPTDVEEEWDTVETTVWNDVETVEYSSMQNGQNYVNITIPDTGESSYPVILWIHGGGYITGDRANVALSTTKEYLLAQGYAFVSVEYTLTTSDGTENGTAYGAAGMPQMIKDIKLAIRFLRANASTYSLDTSFIAAMGESAGAGLALLCATTNSGSYARTTYGDDYYEDLTTGWANYSSDVQAAISYCGPTCFSGDYYSNLYAYLGSDMASNYTAEQLETLSMVWSPLDIIDDTCAPLYLTYSEADTTVPISHYNDFITWVDACGVDSKSVIYEASLGIGHVDRSGFDQYSAYVSLANWLAEINV